MTLFASKAFSIVTGFIFVIAVTRNISSYDFGVWQNIGDMVGYFVMFSGLIPGWATRSIARGHKNAASTVVLANLAISIPFFVAWILMAPRFAKIAGSDAFYYMLAVLMILGTHLKPAFEGIAQAKRPHLLGADLIIHELTMVTLGAGLVMFLKLGLEGALIAVISSNFVDVLFYLVALRSEFGRKMNWTDLRNWLKSSSINIYGMVGDRLGSLIGILLIVYGGAIARGYVGAANTVALSISYASSFGVGLYPKLLSGGRSEDVETITRMVFMFAIPMVVGTLVLASPLLTILNPVYGIVTPVLYLMAVYQLILCFSGILDTVITGTERIDETSFKMKDLIRSRLFLPSTLSYASSAIIVPLLYFVLIKTSPSALEAAVYYAAVLYASVPVWLTVRYLVARRCLAFRLPVREFTKYAIASAVMAAILLQLPIPARISTILPIVGLGATVYFIVLLVIDGETRRLFRGIFMELRGVKNKRTITKVKE